MTDMIAKLKAALDLVESHALKTIHLAEKANDPAKWEAWYGNNYPRSYLKLGEDITIATVETVNHEADTMYIRRAVKRVLVQAHADLRTVAAHRELIGAFEEESAYLATDLHASGGVAHGLHTALTLIAKGYGIEVPE